MRIEKHANTCYISHNGITIFLNKTTEGFEFKVTERTKADPAENSAIVWRTVGIMDLKPDELKLFINYLAEVSK